VVFFLLIIIDSTLLPFLVTVHIILMYSCSCPSQQTKERQAQDGRTEVAAKGQEEEGIAGRSSGAMTLLYDYPFQSYSM
jgi:hypothetical protein